MAVCGDHLLPKFQGPAKTPVHSLADCGKNGIVVQADHTVRLGNRPSSTAPVIVSQLAFIEVKTELSIGPMDAFGRHKLPQLDSLGQSALSPNPCLSPCRCKSDSQSNRLQHLKVLFQEKTLGQIPPKKVVDRRGIEK